MAYLPKFTITSHLLNIIEEISVYRERIQLATVHVPWVPALQQDARVINTHCSTAIEGNPLTEEEVRKLAEGEALLRASEKAKREVLNYYAALRFVEKQDHKNKLTNRDILKLHSIIAAKVMDQGKAGGYRKIPVRVGHYVPPAFRDVPQLMDELINWINKTSQQWSPVISSAIVHYRFEEIHPFADGNGRVGRALALWELYRRGFDTLHIFSVDEIYWENRQRYYEALASVQKQKGDLTSWLEFAAEALHLSLERVLVRIQQISVDRKTGRQLVLRPKQEQILHLLRDRGAMSPCEIWDALGVTKQGALDILNPLINAGLVERIGSRKSGKYKLV